jgi:hypothetical protein
MSGTYCKLYCMGMTSTQTVHSMDFFKITTSFLVLVIFPTHICVLRVILMINTFCKIQVIDV